MAKIATLTADLELNSAQFRKELDKANKSMRNTRSRSRDLNKGILQQGTNLRVAAVAWAGFGAAVAAGTALLAKSVDTFSEIESSQLRTQALLNATGNAAGRTFGQLEEQANSVARATLASTQDIRQAQAILLTFRSVQEENFDRTIELSQDLAAVLGTQAKDAALQLGKALEDPATGLTALRRSGVSFSQAQKDLINDMVETGRIAEAQGLILDTLGAQVGGAGAGTAGGIAGKVDGLAQSWEDFLVSLAKTGPARAAANGLGILSAGIDGLNDAITQSEDEKLAKLAKEIGYYASQLESGRIRPGLVDEYESQIAFRQRQLEDILQRRVLEAEAEKAATQAATDARKQAEIERIQARVKTEQDVGARTLATLESQLANEDQALQIAHQRRLEQIRNLQLSEQAIRQAGFDTLSDLQANFEQRSLQIVQDSIAQRRAAEQESIRQEQERHRAELERQREENDDLVNLQQERFQRIHEATLEAQGRTIEIERLRYINEQNQLQEEMQRLRDRNLTTAATEAEFRIAKENAERIHQQRINDIHQQAEEERLQRQLKFFDILSNAALTADERQLAAAIQIGKAIFDVKKRQKTKEALLAGKLAIQEAWSSAPFPANVPAVLLTTAETAANVAEIQGIAHSGLDRVPREGTYLLQRGEGVLQPRANRELMEFLSNQKTGGNVNVTVVNNAGANVTARDGGIDEQGNRQLQIFVDAMGKAINNGDLDQTLQQNYGITRSAG